MALGSDTVYRGVQGEEKREANARRYATKPVGEFGERNLCHRAWMT